MKKIYAIVFSHGQILGGAHMGTIISIYGVFVEIMIPITPKVLLVTFIEFSITSEHFETETTCKINKKLSSWNFPFFGP